MFVVSVAVGGKNVECENLGSMDHSYASVWNEG
jgi:hypothetical protein